MIQMVLQKAQQTYTTQMQERCKITAAGSANWNTAYGWGDHSTAGYQSAASLTTDIDADIILRSVNPKWKTCASWNGSDTDAWVSQQIYTLQMQDVASFLNGNLSGHIIPDTTETYDLGSATYRFRDLYLAGNTINLGGTQLQRTNAGKITWDGNDLQDYNNLSNGPHR